MGQYGNQPDFATTVDTVASLPLGNIKSAAIYIGAVVDPLLNTTITVRPVVDRFFIYLINILICLC